MYILFIKMGVRSMSAQRDIFQITPEIRAEIVKIVDERIREAHVTKEDFSELKAIVKELGIKVGQLAEAQKKTEQRVEELAEAQKKTEQRVEELVEAQKKTEQRVEELAEAQKKTEQRVEELAEAQKKTEQRVEELAHSQKELLQAQKRLEERVLSLEERMEAGFKSLSDQIAALGSRWGIYNEATFRATIKGILGKQKGIEIKSGHYGDREVDIIIRDGEHIILEITSRLRYSDVEKLIASGEDYKQKHGIEPLLMIATNYISPKLMQRILTLPQKIDVFSYEGEE